MKPRVIITAYAHVHLTEGLQRMGYEVDVRQDITYNELTDTIDQYEGMVLTTRLQIDRALLDNAKSLKWIGRLGSGMEIIDTHYASSKGIACISSPEGNRDAVAEWCLGTLIGLMRNFDRAHEEVKSGKWVREGNRGLELRGKTVGIIGYGNTGTAFANLLQPFGVKVLANDKYKVGFSGSHVMQAEADDIAALADVISFHLPLNNETRHFADATYFNKMLKKPLILNSSRGNVIDTPALIMALDEGKVAGAGLDVLENEDLSSYSLEETNLLSNLSSRANVTLTPHIAGYSHEALFKMADVLLQKISGLQKSLKI